MHRTRSVSTQLFISYSALIGIGVLVFVLLFYLFTSTLLARRTTNSLESLTLSTAQYLDGQIRTMDNAALAVAYAVLTDENRDRFPRNTRGLTQSILTPSRLAAIIGPFGSIPELYVHERDGQSVAAGLASAQTAAPWKQTSRLSKAVALGGAAYISLPHPDPAIALAIPIYADRRYVSLCRSFFDAFGEFLGVIEVEQDTNVLFRDLAQLHAKSNAIQLFVGDAAGRILFGTGQSITDAERKLLSRVVHRDTTDSPVGTESRNGDLITFVHSAYSGLTVVIQEPKREVLAPVYAFSTIVITGSLIFLLITLALTYLLAQRITAPIKNLRSALHALDGEMLMTGTPVALNSNLNELEELNAAFHFMREKLKHSVEDLIRLKSHETMTHMLALQSQMSPHFIVNTLANIGVMAEEGMNDQIVSLCADLSSLYRYVSSGYASLVPLTEELQFARAYLQCISFRLSSALEYRFSAEHAHPALEVPKLCVQPLVENAIKHGLQGAGMIRITVDVISTDERWKVRVEDNGCGFSADTQAELAEKFRTAGSDMPLPSAAGDGIGLVNIYTRLRILYGTDALFSLENSQDGGSRVTIGGLAHARLTV